MENCRAGDTTYKRLINSPCTYVPMAELFSGEMKSKRDSEIPGIPLLYPRIARYRKILDDPPTLGHYHRELSRSQERHISARAAVIIQADGRWERVEQRHAGIGASRSNREARDDEILGEYATLRVRYIHSAFPVRKPKVVAFGARAAGYP